MYENSNIDNNKSKTDFIKLIVKISWPDNQFLETRKQILS